MTQIFTIILTIFYVAWLCFVAFALHRIAHSIAVAAAAMAQVAAQRSALDDHPA